MGCIPKVAIGMEKVMINQWILGVFPQFSDKAKTEANCVCAVKDDGGQPVATVVCENDCLLHNLNLLKRFALNRPGSRPHNWWMVSNMIQWFMMRHSRYTKTVELRYLVYLGIADVDNAGTSVKSCPGVSLRRAWAHDVPPNQMIRSGSHYIYIYMYIYI